MEWGKVHNEVWLHPIEKINAERRLVFPLARFQSAGLVVGDVIMRVFLYVQFDHVLGLVQHFQAIRDQSCLALAGHGGAGLKACAAGGAI